MPTMATALGRFRQATSPKKPTVPSATAMCTPIRTSTIRVTMPTMAKMIPPSI